MFEATKPYLEGHQASLFLEKLLHWPSSVSASKKGGEEGGERGKEKEGGRRRDEKTLEWVGQDQRARGPQTLPHPPRKGGAKRPGAGVPGLFPALGHEAPNPNSPDQPGGKNPTILLSRVGRQGSRHLLSRQRTRPELRARHRHALGWTHWAADRNGQVFLFRSFGSSTHDAVHEAADHNGEVLACRVCHHD